MARHTKRPEFIPMYSYKPGYLTYSISNSDLSAVFNNFPTVCDTRTAITAWQFHTPFMQNMAWKLLM